MQVRNLRKKSRKGGFGLSAPVARRLLYLVERHVTE